jgi:hypothetical protein
MCLELITCNHRRPKRHATFMDQGLPAWTGHDPCLALPCLALPCLALPCLALPCLPVSFYTSDLFYSEPSLRRRVMSARGRWNQQRKISMGRIKKANQSLACTIANPRE